MVVEKASAVIGQLPSRSSTPALQVQNKRDSDHLSKASPAKEWNTFPPTIAICASFIATKTPAISYFATDSGQLLSSSAKTVRGLHRHYPKSVANVPRCCPPKCADEVDRQSPRYGGSSRERSVKGSGPVPSWDLPMADRRPGISRMARFRLWTRLRVWGSRHRPIRHAALNSSTNTIPPRFLWLNGPPGSGKSVVSGQVIKYLTSYNLDCCYFFFKNDAKATVTKLLLSLAYQVADVNIEAREALLTMIQNGDHVNTQDHTVPIFC